MARAKAKGARSGKAETVRVGIIGGSGLYTMHGLQNAREVRVKTPFGDPSDAFVIGDLEGKRVAFLSRHGRGHRITPSEINYRANVYGMKLLGVERIISMSAVGSLREDLRPQDFVLPDQFFDRTRHRADTFFGAGLVAHIMFDKPTCPQVAKWLGTACERAGVSVHLGGTYVCMEGPQFSTKAESHTYRQLRFDVIGMTNLTEAKLAREAEICYGTCAMVTDYDCWHPDHDAVTIAMVIENLNKNTANAHNVIRQVVAAMPEQRECACASALATAIITDRKMIPAATQKKLMAIVGKYIS